MALHAGEEFNLLATPSQELLQKLAYLAQQGNDSVLTGALESPRHIGADASSGRGDKLIDTIQFLTMEDQRREQMRQLSDRLDQLDRASERAVREAQDRLDEVRRNANRTEDGRLAFEAEDGTIYDEHGNEVQEDEIDRSTWKADASTWGELQDAQRSVDAAADLRRDVLDAKETLDTDPSQEDLDSLEARIGELETIARGLRPTDPLQQRSAGTNERAETRSTSAAKLYDDEQPGATGAALEPTFSGAADSARPDTPDPPPATPVPNVSFRPD